MFPQRSATPSPIAALLGCVLGCVLGCGGGGDTTAEPPVEVPVCPAPELLLPDGSCSRPGVAPDRCAEGFAHDGHYGCEPLLPPDPCPAGLLAVPGDAGCRPVMDCGDGTWGDIPVDEATIFVDAAYLGGSSDGSAARPFVTIGDGLAAAPAGALIAVAAGSYQEDLLLQGKPVRLWGRCPELVEIVSTGAEVAALIVIQQTDGTLLRGFAVRGPGGGVIISGTDDVTLDQLWIHDNGGRGIGIESTLGTASVLISASLVEGNQADGLFVMGSSATVDGSLVRQTQPGLGAVAYGRGVNAQVTFDGVACDPQERAAVTLRRTVIEQNHDVGVFVGGADATIEGSVVRTTQPRPGDLESGRGINAQPHCPETLCTPTTASTLALRGSLIEGNHDVGLFVTGSSCTVDDSVVRSTASQASDLEHGQGINVQVACWLGGCDPSHRGSAVIRGTLVEDSHHSGMIVYGSDVTVEDSVLRATALNAANGFYGDGLAVLAYYGPASLTVSRAMISDSARSGIASFGGQVSIGSTRVDCAAFALNGETFEGQDFHFTDLGGNSCGCPASPDGCKVESAGLTPPQPLVP